MKTAAPAALAQLDSIISGDVLTDDVSRAVYASAACIYRIEPLGVVLPKDVQDVVETVRHCREHHLPIIPRGGGSGLAGQAVGAGVILDFTRYMDGVLEMNKQARRVVVQPGITLGKLNERLRPLGLYFPPDPSSGNYATLGGMIANNSSGSHSLKYGATIEYVRRLTVVTDTGEIIEATGRQVGELDSLPARERGLYAGAADIARRYSAQIEQCMPKTSKNSSGYRLDRLIEGAGDAAVVHLERLMCGSEGTLGVIVEAELEIAQPPACTELAVLAFRDLQAAADAVPLIAELEPSAIEALDRNAAEVVRERRPEMAKFLPADAELLIFVEFDGPDRAPLADKVARLKREMVDERRLAAREIDAADAGERAMLWAVRKAVLPILYNLPGPKRVVAFIEDVAVPVEAIPRYMAGLRKILDANDAPFAVLGHAGEGNFHVRPMLDLAQPAEVQKMVDIAEQVFDLAISLGGTMSGEHGDGIVRTEFLRRQFGELYPALEEVKALFDPDRLLNPGKIVGGSQGMCENLKFGPDYAGARQAPVISLLFDNGEYERLLEKCQGCGTCRTLTADTSMCPMFKTLKDERLSPRGKVSLLRELLAGSLADSPANRAQLDRVLELCLNCGMCTVECPVLAEVPLLINEARARRIKATGVPLVKRLVSIYPALSRPMPGFLNRIGGRVLEIGPLRGVMQKFTGIDRRRSFPPIRPVRKVREVHPAEPKGRVALFADLYASLHDPEIIECAVDILEYNGIDVIYPPQKEVGIVEMTAGAKAAVRRKAEYNLRGLGAAAADGRLIVCTEPSGAMCLRREYTRYTNAPAAKLVAGRTRDFFEFLRELKREGALRTDFIRLDEQFIYHTPCHLAAMNIGLPAVEILRDIPGIDIRVLQKNCCGMAGSFGVAAAHYDLAAQIGKPLFDEIEASGCRNLITECGSCRMQIEEMTAARVVHPVKLLHRACGLGK